ncbi:MAG: elongation factor maturation arginine rhamnosyltransferase EarP [Pseudomonadota bacterium]|jgi:uncharacterized repeat protein (TIGR03837 family)
MPALSPPGLPNRLRWDVFCQVVDNHGDAGVAWRLCSDLAARGQMVRLWIDLPDALPEVASALAAPDGKVQVRLWDSAALDASSSLGDAPHVIVECFGCPIAMTFIAKCARKMSEKGQKLLWINLEYLTAQSYAERNHALPSPVANLPSNCERFFYYPGFTPHTGGLLREEDLLPRQEAFQRQPQPVDMVLHRLGLPPAVPGERLISLFCYEPLLLPALLHQLTSGPQLTRLLVTPGRAAQAVRAAQQAVQPCSKDKSEFFPLTDLHGQLSISYLPWLPQRQYDELLWACDFNFVRGEDSLVRALWAGQPFAWHIYPQHDGAHVPKLDAFLNWLDADPAYRRFMRAWNGVNGSAQATELPPIDTAAWAVQARMARTRLLTQADLVSTLFSFVRKQLNPL